VRILLNYARLPAQGTTNRVRLKEEKFLATAIALPPLPEQQRIVSRIEELAAKIGEAQGLRRQAVEEAEAVYQTFLASVMDSNHANWIRETIGEVILSMDAGWSPQYDERPAKADEWGVLKTTSVQWCEFRPFENKLLPSSLSPRPELCVEVGDVLVTRAGPRKRVGVVAAVRNDVRNLMISDKLIRLRPDQSNVQPRFLELAIASPFSQDHLVNRKTGLADAQVNISQAILRTTPVSYTSLTEQHRIIAYLENLQTKVNTLKRIQSSTAAEMDAMLPSILDKSFQEGFA
jgi:type I restriction enzyme S subunit